MCHQNSCLQSWPHWQCATPWVSCASASQLKLTISSLPCIWPPAEINRHAQAKSELWIGSCTLSTRVMTTTLHACQYSAVLEPHAQNGAWLMRGVPWRCRSPVYPPRAVSFSTGHQLEELHAVSQVFPCDPSNEWQTFDLPEPLPAGSFFKVLQALCLGAYILLC